MDRIKPGINRSPYVGNLPEERKVALSEFVDFIHELQEKYHVHGHGVSSEQEAQNIEQHGLYTAWIGLEDFSHPLKADEELLAKQVTYWDYEARKYIVLIAVPAVEEYAASGVADDAKSAYDNRMLSKQFADKFLFEDAEKPDGVRVPLNAKKRIPPSKIIGYWNDKEGKLHRNPRWQAVPSALSGR